MLGDIVTVRVASTLDFRNATTFKDRCLKEMDRYAAGLVLDFTDTVNLSSPGLGSVFSLYRHVTDKGIPLVLAGISDQVMPVIRLTRIYRVIPCFSSVQAAKDYIYEQREKKAA